MNQEIWKIISDFPNYEVSNHGRVRRRVTGRGTWAGRILSDRVTTVGYKAVSLSNDYQHAYPSVARLVLTAFVGDPPDSYQANHINGDKLDDRIENLEWTTRDENMQHAKRTGLLRPVQGEKHYAAILTADQVLEIRAFDLSLPGISQKRLAKMYGVAESTIEDIRGRHSWRHLK